MNKIEDIAERLDILLENSKSIPFTDSVRINRQEFEDLLYELKLAIPESIKQAEDVIDNCHEYVDNAKQQADYILENARMEASKLVSEHQVYKQAEFEAEKLKDDTTSQIHEDYNNAIRAIDGLLADVSEKVAFFNGQITSQYQDTTRILGDYANEVYEMRQELRKGQ